MRVNCTDPSDHTQTGRHMHVHIHWILQRDNIRDGEIETSEIIESGN